MATTVKVTPIAAPKAAPVVAVQVQKVVDHPSVATSATGALILNTATGVVTVQPGDYVVTDGKGGFKCIPQAFLMLYYNVSQ